ncbi:MAG: GWxTD domain-containing protein [Bacteroidetes bacterium]|nr:GWxTD domain-containing protein [Rhodothermia bacterium]MCS7155701.1 GWxTD domain-containing protein [Bacteroidota bacterium]MCX7906560.1 GWxTD domain-containing protein [Bacteroidota bacterium]MDW8137159.1 GWxTD domain-containing protein [Bacteroidota bacterium]MDW8284971.1 GWxTD domain-containing protein [Bacteroidota bacterium]
MPVPLERGWLTPWSWPVGSDSVALGVGWRIPYRGLPFLRQADGRYRAELELRLEVRMGPASLPEPVRAPWDGSSARAMASDGPASARRAAVRPALLELSWTQLLWASTYAETQDAGRFAMGFRLLGRFAPGRYSVLMRWRDPISGQGGALQASVEAHPSISSPLWAEPGPDPEARTLLLLGSAEVPFARSVRALWTLRGPLPQEGVQVQLFRLARARDTVGLLERSLLLRPRPGAWRVDSLGVAHLESVPDSWALEADLEGEKLELNTTYRVQLRWRDPQTGRAEVRSWILRPYWLDMPAVLWDPELSVEVLRYIASEELWRSIRRARGPDRWERFLAFWRERDPSPETAYNELMVEFYRRVQEAQDRFSTPRTPGWRSDRGRIYITYGPPARIERRYPPGRPAEEIWYYPDRGLEFVFVATSSVGDFELRR